MASQRTSLYPKTHSEEEHSMLTAERFEKSLISPGKFASAPPSTIRRSSLSWSEIGERMRCGVKSSRSIQSSSRARPVEVTKRRVLCSVSSTRSQSDSPSASVSRSIELDRSTSPDMSTSAERAAAADGSTTSGPAKRTSRRSGIGGCDAALAKALFAASCAACDRSTRKGVERRLKIVHTPASVLACAYMWARISLLNAAIQSYIYITIARACAVTSGVHTLPRANAIVSCMLVRAVR
eukprot:2215274-Pleurochrysis_carterae.AAC.2